jgi:hypothetical protein
MVDYAFWAWNVGWHYSRESKAHPGTAREAAAAANRKKIQELPESLKKRC